MESVVLLPFYVLVFSSIKGSHFFQKEKMFRIIQQIFYLCNMLTFVKKRLLIAGFELKTKSI